jgi:hypothetical protein
MSKIRKKLPQRKITEEFLKANVHNLRQYNYLRYMSQDMIMDYKQLHAK